MTFKPMPVLTILSVISIAILVMFGNWQWGKYARKSAMETQPVVEATFETFTGERLGLPQQFDYELYEGMPAWRTFEAVRGCLTPDGEASGPCDDLYFIDTGILQTMKPETAVIEFPEIDLSGISVRPVDRQSYAVFGGQKEGTGNQWQQANAEAMAEKLGLEAPNTPVLLEPEMVRLIFVSSNGRASYEMEKNPFAEPVIKDDLPPARHLGYALTWYGLALALIGVYLAFHKARGRLRFGK